MRRVLFGMLLFTAGAHAQGDDLFLKGQYADAIGAFERLTDAQQTPAVLNRVAISYHMLGKFREAEAAYRRAIKADPNLAASYNNLGALFYSQRKFSDADSEFRRAADRNADNAVLHANLHAARYARDNDRAARLRADELAAGGPLLLEPLEGEFVAVALLLSPQVKEQAWIHEVRGDSYAARKLFDDAVIEYKKSLAVDRYNAAVVNRLGVAYHHLRKMREAEQQYREAIRLRPNFLDALINLGVVDYMREEYEGAVSRYTRALKLQPRSVSAWRNLGACYFAMKRWEEGGRAYQQALALDPQLFTPQSPGAGPTIQMLNTLNSMMFLQFAKIFAGRGDSTEAIRYLEKAVDAGLTDVKMIKDDEAFRKFSNDVRFARLIERMTAEKSRG